MPSYNLTPAHKAIIERDKHRLEKHENLLTILAMNKINGKKPIRWDDYTAKMRVELHNLITDGKVRVNAFAVGSECIYMVELTDKGFNEAFADAL